MCSSLEVSAVWKNFTLEISLLLLGLQVCA